jgi:FixJ family two-component response regulator
MVMEQLVAKKGQTIWLIDRRDHWRERTLCTLLGAGFDARAWSSYEYPPSNIPPGQVPSLVIVSGTRIGEEEDALAQRILEFDHPLLVVSGRVPIELMRAIFRAGARDVVETPPNQEQMVTLVEQSLLHGLPVSSYELVAKER